MLVLLEHSHGGKEGERH